MHINRANTSLLNNQKQGIVILKCLQKHSFTYSSLVFTDDRSCADCSRLNIASLDVVVLNQI